MALPNRAPDSAQLPPALAESLNKPPLEVHLARDYMLVYASQQDVEQFDVDRALFDRIDLGTGGVIVTAPGEDCGTDNVGDFHAAPVLNLFPNPMSPEHSMVYVSGLDNPQTPIRVLASDGRVAWQGTGIVSSPGVVGFPIRESISPGTYFIQVDTSTPSGNIPLMVW